MENTEAKSINMNGLTIDEVYVGQKASFSKTISEHDVYAFAGIICDFNPVHINSEFAKETRFGERIAHGMIAASLASTVIGMSLPGSGAIYLGQSCNFLKPVRFGDTITMTGEIVDIKKEKRILTIKMTGVNQHGEVVIEGESTAMAKKA